MTAGHSSAPPPPELGGLADPVGGDAAAGTETFPSIGTNDLLLVVSTPMDADRCRDAPAVGANFAAIVQLPLGARELPSMQVVESMLKSALSPPVAIVMALLVANVSGAVPVLRRVTVALDEAPTAVALNIAPPGLGE
jgi:threonine/homoserine efflux transporter RhtA